MRVGVGRRRGPRAGGAGGAPISALRGEAPFVVEINFLFGRNLRGGGSEWGITVVNTRDRHLLLLRHVHGCCATWHHVENPSARKLVAALPA